MIGLLRGQVIEKRGNRILLDVNGVGYEISVPVSLLSNLSGDGKEVLIYIHTHVREDVIALYGFGSDEDKGLFRMLLGVSGIGPKIALSILSSMTATEFNLAVQNEEISRITRIPGLGKKTAQRLILELKSKLPDNITGVERTFDDAVSALINLGYRPNEAQDAVDTVYKRGVRNIEDLLREGLKILN